MTEHIASWLFTYALHSTVLLAAAWLVTWRLVRSHEVRDVIWKSALVGSLITTTLQAGVGFVPVGGLVSVAGMRAAPNEKHAIAPAKAARAVSQPAEKGAVEETPVAGPLFNAAKDTPKLTAPEAAVVPPASEPGNRAQPFALMMWAVGAGLLLVLYGANRLRLFYRLGSRRPVDDPRLALVLHRLRIDAGIRRSVSLTAAPGLSSPVALGSSEIALPEAALTELGPEAQESMLAHELAHLARRDPQWLTLGCLIERIFFFQPLNRLARLRIQESAEFLCDDWAARRTGSGLVLAKCLVKVAEWIDTSPQPVPLSAMAERRSQLVSRIHRLIENHAMRPQPRRFWLIPAAVVLVLISAFSVPGISAVPTDAQQNDDSQAAVSDTGERSMQATLTKMHIHTREIERRAMRQVKAALARGPMMQTPRIDVHPEVNVAPVVKGVMGDVKFNKAMEGVEYRGKHAGDTTNTAVPALIAALKDSDVKVRRAAASSLGNLEDPRSVPALIEALRDSDSEVRACAAEALGDMEDPRSIPGLTAAIKDGSPEVRRRAIEAISNMEGGTKPVDAFIAALADSNSEVREAAVEALSDVQDKRAVRPLIKLLSDPSADVRHQTAHALGNLEDPAAAEPLAAALRDSDADVRSAAAQSLSQLGLTTAPAALIEATKDKNPDVRQNAIQALGEIRDPKSVPTLRVALNDPNKDVRDAAINALSEVRDSSALDALVAALKSSDPNVRRQAAEALGQRDEN
jgi:HEAT repeat protein/beta-lactamase regulating signal transducer with metallopeptidase domain